MQRPAKLVLTCGACVVVIATIGYAWEATSQAVSNARKGWQQRQQIYQHRRDWVQSHSPLPAANLQQYDSMLQRVAYYRD